MAGDKWKEAGATRGSRRLKHLISSSLRRCCFYLSAPRFRLFSICFSTMLFTATLMIYLPAQVDLLNVSFLVWTRRFSFTQHLLQKPNNTIFMLSSVDPNEAIDREKVTQLLDRYFHEGQRLRYFSHHHKVSGSSHFDHYAMDHIDERRGSIRSLREGNMPPYLSNPRFAPYWPQFGHMLESWIRKKRYDPKVLTEMLTAVKYPIDRHHNSADADLNLGKPYRTCAVIGNSGILLNKTYGEFIDSHEMVMRLNNARTSGYENAVGRKTTLSFVNSNVLHICSRRFHCTCHSYGESVAMISYICQISHMMDVLYCSAMHKAPLLVTDPRFDNLCSRIVKYYSLKLFLGADARSIEDWSSAHEGNMFHYSSGLQAVVLALSICEKVDMFGFGKSPYAKHHYHTNQKSELSLHDYAAEDMFYNDLASNLSSSIPFLSEAGVQVPPLQIFR